MNGPLSGKQRRDDMKFAAKEQREAAKAEADETRKQELHEIKLQEAASKANQSLGHKENEHRAKMSEVGGPLSKGILRGDSTIAPIQVTQAASVPTNPEAGPSDTVPVMLTPGEAVIGRKAAQDPKNKEVIEQLVQEGRQGYSKGTTKVTGNIQTQNMLPIMSKVGPRQNRKGYADGTTNVTGALKAEMSKLDPSSDAYKLYAKEISNLGTSADNFSNSEKVVPYSKLRNEADIRTAIGTVPSVPFNADERDAAGRELARIKGDSPEAQAKRAMITSAFTNQTPPVPASAQDPVPPVSTSIPLTKQQQRQIDLNQSIINSPTASADEKEMAAKRIGLYSGSNLTPPEYAKVKQVVDDRVKRNPANYRPQQEVPPVPQADAPLPEASKVPPLEELPTNTDENGSEYADKVDRDNRTPLSDAAIANITKENQQAIDAQAAAIKEDPDKTPQEKHTEMTSFIESIFGPKGMFNAQELTRFALVAAGGMLTGGTTNGSFKYAARDILQHSDTRLAAENTDRRLMEREANAAKRQEVTINAQEARATERALIAQGFDPIRVKKYVEGGYKAEDLGAPKQTLKPTGATPRYLTTQEGPMRDTPIKLEERETMQGTHSQGKEWGTYIKGKDGSQQWVPEAAIDKHLKTVTVPYLQGEHSPEARSKQLDEVVGNTQKSIDSAYDRLKDNKNIKSDQLPSSNQVATRAINVAKDLGFDPVRNGDQKRALQEVIDGATNQMIADVKGGGKPKIIDQYIQAALVQNRTGVGADKFEINGKPMEANKIMKLIDKATQAGEMSMSKRSGENKPSKHEIETAKNTLIKKIASDWESKANREERVRYEKAGSESESPFYRYATAYINKMVAKK